MNTARFQEFDLERLLSDYEQTVEINLSESGVHPLTLAELVRGNQDMLAALLDTSLNYPQVNGEDSLRARIAALYEGADPDNILVTVGAAEANYIAGRVLAQVAGEMVVMMPNYLQLWGVARNAGCAVRRLSLRADDDWSLDTEALNRVVTPDTSVIAVCNPNNPTGTVLAPEEMTAVVEAARGVGAWILADEVYAGAERCTDTQTPSFWGLYDKVIAIGSLSKAYGLPGLRVGWMVAPLDFIRAAWRRHEYTTIAATALSNGLATYALSDDVREFLIDRSRAHVRRGYTILEAWLGEHPETLRYTPPHAGAIACVRYAFDVPSQPLAHTLRCDHSVLVVPGAYSGAEGHLRIAFGGREDMLSEGLARLSACFATMRRRPD